jgi:nucleoredoxin
MEALFGSKLVGKDGEVDTAAALSGKTAIGIYFSAHWCPPCRGFTPKLAQWYKDSLKAKGMEVVFVSSDKDEDSFKEYYGEQPWLAVPFGNKEVKAALNKKFKVQGIPSFVIVDGEGKTITKDGRSAVSEDPEGKNFPWKPKTMKEIFEGVQLVSKTGKVGVQEAFAGKKAVGLYFSAHWCPPCRGFTPKLKEWYEKDLKANGLEIVFVSSDRDEASFKEYYGEQPWLALDFADRDSKGHLSKACKVDGIPSFTIIDPSDFSIINAEGRAAVTGDPQGKELPWKPKPVGDLAAGPGSINEIPTVLIFCESASDAEKDSILATVTPIAKEYMDAATDDDPEYAFLLAKSTGDLSDRIRKMTSLDSQPLSTTMILIDIPSDGAFHVAPAGGITSDSVRDFISKHKAGSLERKQLSQG